jgi:tRNA U34 5-carboxymethylaminomethyl modifying enzyme MnmG/GidA
MSRSDTGYERLSQQMQSLELQARQQVALFKKQQEQLEQRKQELALHSDSEDEDSAQQYAAANEVKEQFRLLDEAQVSHGVTFAQLRAARTHQVIGNVTTDHKSLALVGMPERLVGKIDQRIGNVSTTDKSSAMVGAYDETVDMRDFFKRT